MKRHLISRFKPNMMDPQILQALFVDREEISDSIVARLTMDSELSEHFLILGQRGMGKTHLASIIRNKLSQRTEGERLILAWVNEEVYGLSTFLDLQIAILKDLIFSNADFGLFKPKFEQLYSYSAEEAEILSKRLLMEMLNEHHLVAFIENLDIVFEQIGILGQQKLRSFLQETRVASIVGTARELTPSFLGHESPFFGFFNVIRLQPFSAAASTEFLSRLAVQTDSSKLREFLRTEDGRARIQAVHHLTGGNPRVFMIFADFLSDETQPPERIMEPLLKTIDELTPYYEAKMRELSPQQQKLVEIICQSEKTLTVKDIAQRAFISQQAASAQLRELKERGYVVSQSLGRESYYEVTDQLLRLCLETKRPRQKAFEILVKFLCTWYTPEELQGKLEGSRRWHRYIFQALKNVKNTQTGRRSGPPSKVVDVDFHSVVKDLIESGEMRRALSGTEPPQQLKEALRQIQANIGAGKYRPDLQRLELILMFLVGRYRECIDRFMLLSRDLTADDVELRLVYGASLYRTGYLEEALKAFDEVLASRPDHVGARIGRAQTLMTLGNHKQAIREFDNILKYAPRNAHAQKGKVAALLESNRIEEAVALIDSTEFLQSDEAGKSYLRAHCMLRLSKHSEALNQLSHALQLDSRHHESLILRGQIMLEQGQYQVALESFETAKKSDPADCSVLSGMAKALIQLDRYEEALHCLDRVLELGPTCAEARWNKGVVLGMLGDHRGALKEFKRVESDYNASEEYWLNTAVAYINLERILEATEALQAGIKINPNSHECWLTLGELALVVNDYKEALRCFDHCLSIDYRSVPALTGLGITNACLGEFETALKYFRLAIEINPKDRQLLSCMSDALLNYTPVRISLEAIEGILALNSDFAFGWYLKSELLLRLSVPDYGSAQQSAEKAVKIETNNAIYLLHLIGILLMSSQDKRAEKLLNQFRNAKAGTDFIDHYLNAVSERNRQSALELVEYLLAHGIQRPDLWACKAEIAVEQSKWSDALEAVSHLLESRRVYSQTVRVTLNVLSAAFRVQDLDACRKILQLYSSYNALGLLTACFTRVFMQQLADGIIPREQLEALLLLWSNLSEGLSFERPIRICKALLGASNSKVIYELPPEERTLVEDWLSGQKSNSEKTLLKR
ncbi:MAG: tetratricopeptide repeat protein [Candidatus Obscuribacterales bacterium]